MLLFLDNTFTTYIHNHCATEYLSFPSHIIITHKILSPSYYVKVELC